MRRYLASFRGLTRTYPAVNEDDAARKHLARLKLPATYGYMGQVKVEIYGKRHPDKKRQRNIKILCKAREQMRQIKNQLLIGEPS